MSLDRFACHAVSRAVLNGDLESSAAQVLSLLPRSTQEGTLSKVLKLSHAVTGPQLLQSLQQIAVDLTKTTFAKSACHSCLHNSNIANRYCGESGQLPANHCLFALCAQQGAQDESLLAQRTIAPESMACDDLNHTNEQAALDSIIAEALPPEAIPEDSNDGATAALDFGNEVQMDAGVPDTSEPESSALVTGEQEIDIASTGAPSELGLEALSTAPLHLNNDQDLDESSPEPQATVMEYVDEVRNSWWRNALKMRIADNGTHKELLDFLISCFTAGFRPVAPTAEQSAPNYFFNFAQADGQDQLAPIVASMVDALPLDVVGEFLQVFQVDLSKSGSISVKLLTTLSLDELAFIADELNVPNTDDVCDAYDAGSVPFAKAIAASVGDKVLMTYIPPSLRP